MLWDPQLVLNCHMKSCIIYSNIMLIIKGEKQFVGKFPVNFAFSDSDFIGEKKNYILNQALTDQLSIFQHFLCFQNLSAFCLNINWVSQSNAKAEQGEVDEVLETFLICYFPVDVTRYSTFRFLSFSPLFHSCTVDACSDESRAFKCHIYQQRKNENLVGYHWPISTITHR